jgi:uncharacterized protein (TIGR01777 family)
MKVVITGGSGLIGGCLSRVLLEKGHTVCHLNRCGYNNRTPKKDLTSEKNIFWSNCEVLENADAVIHLAGANVAKPWTKSYKKEILESRTLGTKALMDAVAACIQPPKHIISASGIGYYPEGGSNLLTEDSASGDAFLSQVCRSWEQSLFNNNPKGLSISVVRTGLALSNQSKIVGAARVQFMLSGMVGSVGCPANRWSWIHLEDLCHIYLALLEGKLFPGIYNGVAPTPCAQGEFGLAYERYPSLNLPKYLIYAQVQWWLAKRLNGMIRGLGIRKRPVVPRFLIKCLWGERSVIALTDQFVSAQKLLDQGFCYQYPTIDKAMQHLQCRPEI